MPKRSWPRRILRGCLVIVLALLLLPPAAAGVALTTYLYADLPSVLPEERALADSRRSVVYAADGSEIGEFKESESRVPIPADEMPESLKKAVIAAEDDEFYSHEGFDWSGTARALWYDLRNRKLDQGGSTITQQLVKNLYTGGERTLVRKVREALIASQVERQLEKDEILAKYLNTVYMGESAFGVEAASQSYFRKSARDITLSEAALLAGVLPAPSVYSPRGKGYGGGAGPPAEAAEQRRNLVLDRLLATEIASKEEVAAARAEVPVIHPHPDVVGRYPYFLDYLRRYLLDVKDYSPDLIYRGGLRIETTLEPKLEDKALEVVNQTLDGPEDPEASVVAVEPQTGFVRALVGGKNWEQSKVNLALGELGGGSGRQAGSAFKTFVLARALDAGLPPTKTYPAPRCITPKGFQKPVCNFGNSGYGSANLVKATTASINTVYVQLIVDVGIRQTAELAKRLGISSIDLDKPVYGGIAIGTQEVSPLDMASAYSVFAGRGVRAEPTPVLRITDREDTVIEDNTLTERGKRVLAEPVADNVNQILEKNVQAGTGTRARIGRPAAGKTGTSQNFENAWFVGYTPTLSTAVWMGHPEGNVPMTGAKSAGVGRVTGGSLPAKMWHDFMVTAMEGVEVTEFNEPAPIESLAERAKREQRGGFDIPGAPNKPELPEGGPYYTDPPAPEAEVPTTTTTTKPKPKPKKPPPSRTTPTTEPDPDEPGGLFPGFGDDPGGGDGGNGGEGPSEPPPDDPPPDDDGGGGGGIFPGIG